jgi:NTE family protein
MIFGQVEAINQGPLNDLKVTFKNSSEFAVWLDDKELEVDYLLLPIDVATDHWQTVCQNHVDLTLLIKDEADVSPCPKQARDLAFEGIVIHPREQTIYSNTSRLFAEARPLKIHHVSLCNSFAFDRLARRLAGQATSLVLGGGGARGLAHIGVIKALTELKIPIDCIGGTSMGAFVAALYVLSNDWKMMREMAWDCWVAPGFLKYITLPLVSLLDCRRIENKMNQLFSGKFIEDAAIGFYCTSSNLTRAKVAVHTSGELSTWVIASVSLPGIAPPQIHQGELFVDGAVLNSLPIGPSQDLAPGAIIASNVSLDVDLQVDKGLSRMPTGWQILRQKLSLNQRQRNLPGILDIIDRASMLSSIKQIHDHEASVDISIMPPVGHVDMFSMKSIDCLIQAGYQETVRVMNLDDSV